MGKTNEFPPIRIPSLIPARIIASEFERAARPGTSSDEQHRYALSSDSIARANERDGRDDGPDASEDLHSGDQAPCHIRHERGTQFCPRANADVNEGELDVDVPWKRVPRGHAAVESEGRRQIIFYELVHAHGATFSRPGAADNSCDVQP